MKGLFTILLTLVVCVAFLGCKEKCPLCEQYVGAVKECVKDKAPSEADLAKMKEDCLTNCAKLDSAANRNDRSMMFDELMAKPGCVPSYERDGCDGFLECLKDK